MATFDTKKYSQLDWGVAVTGVIALICLFLPWYGASYGIGGVSYGVSVSGWSTSYGWLGALLIVAAAAYLVLLRAGVNVTKLPVGPAVVVLGASGLGAVIVILRWITLPKGSSLGGVYSYGPRVGLYLTLIVGVVQAVCAYLSFRASGEELPWKPASGVPAGGASAAVPAAGTPPAAPGTPAGMPPATEPEDPPA